MSVPAQLVRFYPRPFRERWGADVRDEADAGGWRIVPNLVAGIAGMWLRPVVWPAGSAAQRRHRAAVLGFAVAFAGWLVGHAVVEYVTGVRNAWGLRGCDVLTMAGLALLLPWPRFTPRLVLHAARRLWPPSLAGLLIVVWANSHDAAAAAPLARYLVLGGWWLTLAAGAVQVCRFVGDLDAAPPRIGRLRAGIWSLVFALAAGGAFVVTRSGVSGAALIALAALAAFTLRDLADLPPVSD